MPNVPGVVKKRHTGTVPATCDAIRVELAAGAHEREVERARVEAGDLVGVGRHEVVAEAGVVVLDDGRHRGVAPPVNVCRYAAIFMKSSSVSSAVVVDGPQDVVHLRHACPSRA